MPESVFRLGKSRSSAAAWYSTVLDTEETLQGGTHGHVHAFVADVM